MTPEEAKKVRSEEWLSINVDGIDKAGALGSAIGRSDDGAFIVVCLLENTEEGITDGAIVSIPSQFAHRIKPLDLRLAEIAEEVVAPYLELISPETGERRKDEEDD